jgi:hypothetical protein
MNDLGRRSNLLANLLQGGEGADAQPPARLRVGTIATVTALAVTGALGIAAAPALARDLAASRAAGTGAAAPAAVVRLSPAASPTPMPMSTATPPPTMPAAPAAPAPALPALPPVTLTNGLTVGPGAACCFTQSGAWTADEDGGAPGFGGPDRWSRSAGATFQWNLGSPIGGRRWDQVGVQVWIPNHHAGAQVRYAVTSTAAGGQQTQSFDLAQEVVQGWYTLPATFRVGTPTRRTGSLSVSLAYLQPYAAAGGGCPGVGCDQMAAAQVRFLWS